MIEINKLSLGNRIKDIRIARKDTLEKFAQAIQVKTNHTLKTTKSNVSKWEKGSNIPNNITLKAIADLGNITVEDLLGTINILISVEEYKYLKEIERKYTEIKDLINN